VYLLHTLLSSSPSASQTHPHNFIYPEQWSEDVSPVGTNTGNTARFGAASYNEKRYLRAILTAQSGKPIITFCGSIQIDEQGGRKHVRDNQRENIQAALALLLGPETPSAARQRALRRLTRRDAAILPAVLIALNNHPEITTPAWPDWPPQYKFCARLLLKLGRNAHLSLEDLLHHLTIQEPRGPVLWISVIEATELELTENHETLLCEGLATAWETVRYAAAMALGTRAHRGVFQPATLQALAAHQGEYETSPVRLAAAYALLHSGEASALKTLQQLATPPSPEEVRMAALFTLSTTRQSYFSLAQLQKIINMLIQNLRDENHELALQAAHTLGKLALATTLPTLKELLIEDNPQLQIVVLHTLEGIARHRHLCREIIQRGILSLIVPSCRAELPEQRRQACHTLAVCGGEYASAVLATILQDQNHPGHLEAIESLHMLYGVLRPGVRQRVLHWLTSLFSGAPETSQVAALDTLTILLSNARIHQKDAWRQLCIQTIQEGNLSQLLHNESAWIRQRTLELLVPLGDFRYTIPDLHAILEQRLSVDDDSSVRACAAYVCGQINATWALSPLILALLDPNQYVAQAALHTLTQIASSQDLIVLYVMNELTHLHAIPSEALNTLAREAQQYLKKRRRGLQLPPSTLHGLK
jgi:hypothetical protein